MNLTPEQERKLGKKLATWDCPGQLAMCGSCDGPLWAPRSIDSGLCSSCHPDGPNIGTVAWPPST